MDREGMWEMEERSRDLVACRVPHHNTAQEKERRRWERFGDKVSSVLLRRDEDGMHETTTDELADVEMPSGEMPRELGELELILRDCNGGLVVAVERRRADLRESDVAEETAPCHNAAARLGHCDRLGVRRSKRHCRLMFANSSERHARDGSMKASRRLASELTRRPIRVATQNEAKRVSRTSEAHTEGNGTFAVPQRTLERLQVPGSCTSAS